MGTTKKVRNMSTGKLVAGDDKETPQDLPQEWTRSTKTQRVLGSVERTINAAAGATFQHRVTDVRHRHRPVEEEPKFEIDL